MGEEIANAASLSGVDSWFHRLRCRLNMLERPVTSATNSRRWNAYAGYNPTWMTKLIEIMRVYHNYCMTNKRSLTESGTHSEEPSSPAMRLGVVNKVHTVNDILNFTPNI